MNDLIDAIITFLKNAIDAGTINITGIEKNHISKGIAKDPGMIQRTKFPYIQLDDGGERTEETDSSNTLWRIYSIVLEFAVFTTNIKNSLEMCLDLSSQIESVIKTEANRQEDDLIWGINIIPFEWDDDPKFYRGRTVILEWRKLEFVYDRY